MARQRRWPMKPPPGTPMDWGHPHNKGLVLACDFLGPGGNGFYDGGPIKHPLAAPGATFAQALWGAGKEGIAGLLDESVDGDGAEVRFTRKTAFPANNGVPYTVIARVWTAAAQKAILQIGMQSDSNFAMGLGINTNSKLHTMANGPADSAPVSVASVPFSQWVTVAVANYATNSRLWYINGLVETNTTTTNMGQTVGTAQPISIGQGFTNSTPDALYDFIGLIDYVRLYSRGLTEGELRSLAGDPWQVYQPHRRVRYYSIQDAGEDVTLDKWFARQDLPREQVQIVGY